MNSGAATKPTLPDVALADGLAALGPELPSAKLRNALMILNAAGERVGPDGDRIQFRNSDVMAMRRLMADAVRTFEGHPNLKAHV